MKRRLNNVRTALVVAALGSTLAVANGRHVHDSRSDYVQSDDKQEIVLHSDDGTHGVVVSSVHPTPLHGLQAGDVIASVDGRAVAGVDDITNALHHHTKTPAAIVVRRAGANVALTWSYGEFNALFPEPPAPPKPPLPPEPPVAPEPPPHR